MKKITLAEAIENERTRRQEAETIQARKDKEDSAKVDTRSEELKEILSEVTLMDQGTTHVTATADLARRFVVIPPIEDSNNTQQIRILVWENLITINRDGCQQAVFKVEPGTPIDAGALVRTLALYLVRDKVTGGAIQVAMQDIKKS